MVLSIFLADIAVQMEDRAICVEDLVPDRKGPRAGFFAVYDGHNGNAAVDFVSSRVHKALQAALVTAPLRYMPLPHIKHALVV